MSMEPETVKAPEEEKAAVTAEQGKQEEKKNGKKEKKKKTVQQEILSWVWTILAAVAIATFIRAAVAEPIRVDGKSMTNTLQDGEVVLVNKMAYGDGILGKIFYGNSTHLPQRNDIVICRYPNRMEGSLHLGASLSFDRYTVFVKRVVALPGDTVEIKNGTLYVNGEAVPDPEFMASVPGDYPLRQLGANQYMVVGDNRRTSHDSRAADVGPIGLEAIMGKVECVMLPFGNRRVVK